MKGLEALADRVAAGEALTDADAQVILGTQDLISIGMMADEVRRRLHGMRTTFVRVIEVHVEAVPTSIPAIADAGEVRIVGRPASGAAAIEAVRRVADIASGTPVTGFSLVDLQAVAPGPAFARLCGDLRHAGLDAVVDVPIDVLESGAPAVMTARDAGLLVQRITVHAPAVATHADVIAHARDLHAAVGGFVAFAPLPRDVSVATPTTGYDDVKHVALSRLMLTSIPSIQVDWALYGPKLAQVALTMGADDVDRVAAEGPGSLGTRRSPLEEIRGNIKAAALEPVERDGRFNVREQTGS